MTDTEEILGGEAGVRRNVTGHGALRPPAFAPVPDSSQGALGHGSCIFPYFETTLGTLGKGNSGMASLSLDKAHSFFLYLAPLVRKCCLQVPHSRIPGFPLPSLELLNGWKVEPFLLPEGPGRLQQLKGGDAGDINWDGNDGPWQPMLFQGAADHVAGRA